jgi:uncharacterized protein (TIRG00374 family)
LVKLGVGIAVLLVLLTRVDLREMIGLYRRLGVTTILVLFALGTFDRILMAYKWGVLLRSSGYEIRFLLLLKSYFYGMFAGSFLPASVGGDVVRFFVVAKGQIPRSALLASMIVEKAAGFIAMGSMASVAILLLAPVYASGAELTRFTYFVGGITIVMVGLAVALYLGFGRKSYGRLIKKCPGPLGRKLELLDEQIRLYGGRRRALATFLILTLVEQCDPVVGGFVLARGLGIEISFLQIACVVLISLFVARIPVSISGIGIQEGVFVGLFVMMGLPAAEGLALSLGARLLDIIFPVPFVVWFLRDALSSIRGAKRESGGNPPFPQSPAPHELDPTPPDRSGR